MKSEDYAPLEAAYTKFFEEVYLNVETIINNPHLLALPGSDDMWTIMNELAAKLEDIYEDYKRKGAT